MGDPDVMLVFSESPVRRELTEYMAARLSANRMRVELQASEGLVTASLTRQVQRLRC